MRPRDKNVVFIAETGQGTARPLYRAKIPTRGLKELGWRSRVCEIMYEQEDHRLNGYMSGELIQGYAPRFIVAHMLYTPVGTDLTVTALQVDYVPNKELIEQAREKGQIFFHDLDDDVWNVPEWNPGSKREAGIGKHYDEWIADVNSGDGLIVSTESIKESAEASGDIKVPIHVLRNGINYQDYNPEHIQHTPFRIGVFSHLGFRSEDFKVAIPALYSALKGRRDEVELWHFGADFTGKEISIRDLLPKFPVNIVERPWVDADSFHKAVEQIDLCIIPAVECKFNDGRSNVIGLACAAGSVPFLSSNIREYNRGFRGVVLNPSDWEECLTEFLDDIPLTKELVKDNRLVMSNWYTPRVIAEGYVRVFEECLNSK